MVYTHILYELTDHIGRITLNRPEKRNALNRSAIAELVDALAAIRDDAQVYLVVVTGAGDEAFCAGADVNDFLNKDALAKREQNEAYRQLCKAFMEVGKPVIGAINGLALAGGAGLTLLFDFVLSSERARFGFPEIKVGIFPMMVMANLFRVIGRRKAVELVMTGEMISAQEAERIGLINRAVPHEQLRTEVNRLASNLLQYSPSTLRLGKEAFCSSSDMSAPEALDYMKEMATLVLLTEDAKEGLDAFLAKRKPCWKGR